MSLGNLNVFIYSKDFPMRFDTIYRLIGILCNINQTNRFSVILNMLNNCYCNKYL